MKRWTGTISGAIVVLVAISMTLPLGHAADTAKELTVRYVLATAKAFRTVYVKGVIAKAKQAGVKAREDWVKDQHGIMLPAQFVKAAGAELKEFELGLVGLYPLFKSNSPKTDAEVEALRELAANPKKKFVTFRDGIHFKGLSADFAISQGCADCHNSHPKTTKTDWKRGDLMGAIIVRMRN